MASRQHLVWSKNNLNDGRTCVCVGGPTCGRVSHQLKAKYQIFYYFSLHFAITSNSLPPSDRGGWTPDLLLIFKKNTLISSIWYIFGILTRPHKSCYCGGCVRWWHRKKVRGRMLAASANTGLTHTWHTSSWPATSVTRLSNNHPLLANWAPLLTWLLSSSIVTSMYINIH